MNPFIYDGRGGLLPRSRVAVLLAVLLPAGATGDDAPDPPADRAPVSGPVSASESSDPTQQTALLKETSLQTEDWVFVSREKNDKLSETWTIVRSEDDPILVCKGSPYGYLRTRREYDNFEMELEWRFPEDANGNSGILLYTGEKDKVWPRSIQIQLHQPVAGSIFPSGDATSDNEIRNVREIARPMNEWNVCRISSVSGTISVEINGHKVGEVTGCHPSKGGIGLQSEGSEVHFRRIRIREMPPVAAPDAPADQSTGWLWPAPSGWSHVGAGICYPSAFTSITRQPVRKRSRRLRKTSHVVHRNALAPDGRVRGCGDCLRLDVAGSSPVVVDRGSDHMRRAVHWYPGD